jgi:hypothetical protein
MTLKYRLGSLGWYNFETLIQTLLKAAIGPGVTSFGGSVDGGRDAGFHGKAAYPNASTAWSGSWIFQVKFIDFDNSGVADARRALTSAFQKEINLIVQRRKSEVKTSDRNYILITNIPVTSQNRKKLQSIASDVTHIRNFAIIDGREVCELLDLHPDVRRSFPQLLALADLDTIINADVLSRSKAYLIQWQKQLSTFVATAAYRRALEALRVHLFIVLDGAPEVGKSTIAAAISLLYAANEYEIVAIRRSNDFHKMLRAKRKQLFIVDDAMGSIALDPSLADDWSRDLAGVLLRLDGHHMMIWTGRTYVIAEAVAQSRLSETASEFPGVREVVVNVGDLTRQERAEMLYNHAKYGAAARLTSKARELVRAMAREIVDHPNLTPERIRQLVSGVLVDDDISAEKVREFLANPGDRWVKAYRRLSQSEQSLLLALLDSATPAPLDDVKNAYNVRVGDLASRTLTYQESYLRLSHGWLHDLRNYSGENLVDFQHPSIRDLLITELREDTGARRKYFQLASPHAIAATIRGLSAEQQFAEDTEHSLVPSDDTELGLFLERIKAVGQSSLHADSWREMLSATRTLIPRAKSTAPSRGHSSKLLDAFDFVAGPTIPPSEVDLTEFAKTVGGRTLNSVAAVFSSMESFEINGAYSLGDWIILLPLFFDLSVYSIPIKRLAFSSALLKRCLNSLQKSKVERVLILLDAIREADPLLFQQHVSAKTLQSIASLLESRIDDLIATGENFGVPEEGEEYEPPDRFAYEDWQSQIAETVDGAQILVKVTGSDGVEGLSRLEYLQGAVGTPYDAEEDTYYGDESWRSESSYWTIDRMFGDL